MKKYYKIILIIVIAIGGLQACSKFEPASKEEEDLLDGPIDNLSNAQNRQFVDGDIAFNDEIFTPATGLGPLFVATSCGTCHAGDGKGHPFTTLTRFGQKDETGNKFLKEGGPQLQNRASPGFTPEQIPHGATFSKFTPPANTGLGFLEAVTDADILAMADPLDMNGDGISGVPNYQFLPEFLDPEDGAIPNNNNQYIHRFGKKAAAYNLLHQTVNAYNQDMGITSTFRPKDVYSGKNIDPEVSDLTVHNVVFYLQTLKAPIQRNTNDQEVLQGQSIFSQIGCDACHKSTLQTGKSTILALSNKTFHPYTDLLLHDMGSKLDDGYTEGSAKTFEWRTPPLWGLGLSPNSQGGQFFLMHDGRAKSIEEAIQLHEGEAKSTRDQYLQLSANQKNALLKFLKSL